MGKKATHKTDRTEIEELTQIINIGTAIAEDLVSIGIKTPQHLIGKDPLKLYQKLIRKTEIFHDPCVLDCFISAVDFMDGNPPQAWWHYTAGRKQRFQSDVDKLRKYPR